jgi:phosphatidylserine/phosphatidylglycerophosphate/cardiolipin synthase-like enzyme
MSVKALSSSSVISEPSYYHREYKNDLPTAQENSWVNTAQRVALTALPFVSLYKPLSFPLSLLTGGLRTYTSAAQLLEAIQAGEAKEIAFAMAQTAISVLALAGTIFAHPVGMLISTGNDLILEVVDLIQNLQKGEYEKAAINCLNIINNALYLALFLNGGIELTIVSLALQILIGVYHARGEFLKGNFIEAAGHLGMCLVRGSQIIEQAKMLQIQRALQAIQKTSATTNVKKSTGVHAVTSQSTDNSPQEASILFSDESGKLKDQYLTSLSDAKSSILIMSYTLSDPEVINMLAKKANEGKKITIVIDKDHMGSVLPFADKFSLLTRKGSEGRIHHKITVIDQETVWIGSANLSPEAFTRQSNTMIYLKNREMAAALHEEMEAFAGLRQRSSRPLPPLIINGQKVELLLFPHVPFGIKNSPEQALNSYGKARLIEMIQNAQTSLRFAICVWTDPEIMQAVIQAKNRGVNVEVIVWKEEESTVLASKLAGIKITPKPHLPLMHNKWMIVDDESFFNTSANWSRSWFSRNDESAVIINNLTPQQKQGLLDYWKRLLLS